MKSMKLAMMGVLLAFGLGACGGDADEWKGKYQSIIDEMCACTTKECADTANDKRRDLRKAFKEKLKGDKDKMKSIGKEMKPLDDKWDACRDKAEAAAGGGE